MLNRTNPRTFLLSWFTRDNDDLKFKIFEISACPLMNEIKNFHPDNSKPDILKSDDIRIIR
jgi:hypothetical protein